MQPETFEPPEKATIPIARAVALMVVLSTLLAATTMAVNVHVDPRGTFGSGNYESLIDESAVLKLAYFEEEAADPELLVIGSSRGRMLAATDLALLHGASTFNLAGQGLRPTDMAQTLEWALQQGNNLSAVIVVIDTYRFGGHQGPGLFSTHADASKILGIPFRSPGLLAPLSTLRGDYVADTARSLWMTHVTEHPHVARAPDQGPRNDWWDPGPVAGPDPALSTPYAGDERPRPKTAATRESLTAAYAADHRDATVRANLRPLLDVFTEALSRGIEVQIWQAPNHPALGVLPGQEAAEAALDRALSSLCGPGFHMYDAAHGAVAIPPAEFEDALHMTHYGGLLIAQAIHEGLVPDGCTAAETAQSS